MRLGIFGGTFDPPHIGHLILADESLAQLGLNRILWVLTPHSPHKVGQSITPLEHRLEMVQAAIGQNPLFELSRIEIDRSPPYYAADTMALLSSQYPQAELVYLMGGDSLRNLPLWHQPNEFVAQCHALGVMKRLGTQVDLNNLETHIPGITLKIKFVDTPLIDISASQIRKRIWDGHPYRYYLPPSVYKIIQARKLYRNPG
jgi:nicotinate-nucleotide adenylyltransferase